MKSQNFKTIIIIVAVIILAVVVIRLNPKENRIAVFDTTEGTFKVELYEDKASITAGNFIKLAKQGFYDGTRFHRVIPRFMIQGGDPLSKDVSKKDLWGTGGPGYTINDEFTGGSNLKGTISMANSGPNTGGSQFFINVALNNYLDNQHAVFGKVVEGYEIVEKISKLETINDRPVNDVITNSITIQED